MMRPGREKYTVLLAEDDEDVVNLLTLYLDSSDFETVAVPTGEEALKILQSRKVDIALADIMMPVMDGYAFIKEARKITNIPIIIISARSAQSDKIVGLNIGADAYITKPFDPLEVVAYVKAVLRRFYDFGPADELSENKPQVMSAGVFELDYEKWTFRKGEVPVMLTASELKIMSKFIQSPGRVFTKSQLYECISGDLFDNAENTIMVHISNLRSKIEDDPSNPKYIVTVRGLGYRFVPFPDTSDHEAGDCG